MTPKNVQQISKEVSGTPKIKALLKLHNYNLRFRWFMLGNDKLIGRPGRVISRVEHIFSFELCIQLCITRMKISIFLIFFLHFFLSLVIVFYYVKLGYGSVDSVAKKKNIYSKHRITKKNPRLCFVLSPPIVPDTSRDAQK